MKKHLFNSPNYIFKISIISVSLVFCSFLTLPHKGQIIQSNQRSTIPPAKRLAFPYKKAGLSPQQAASHLLNRFTFGATPEMIDEVVKTGLENWFENQISNILPDDSLNARLSAYNALNLSNTEILNIYPRGNLIRHLAQKDGVPLNKDSLGFNIKMNRALIDSYMVAKGFKPEGELLRQFINQKVLRAAYSNNQLREVLTDFWFNHFNVAFTKNECSQFILSYERDIIRPNVLGSFKNLLVLSAKSPAMLMYLDNATSAGNNTAFSNPKNIGLNTSYNQPTMDMNLAGTEENQQMKKAMQALANKTKSKGLNENYAREIMELHTLGVDGGYTQNDVTQAARVLTGWTVYPMSENMYYGGGIKKIIDKVGEENLIKKGFVHEGDFFFAINRHDDGEKKVLGKTFPAGGGYEEGNELLDMLAHHPSTAKFICKKLATRFVCDTPAQSLIDKMAMTFTKKDGDLKEVLITMVNAPEFWSKKAIREKIKSPFELAISTVRILHADIKQPYQFFNWSSKMGQKIYYYQAPTGFPDRGKYWINTGSLLNRMNFGLAFATQRIPGVNLNLLALNNNHEPESALEALNVYAKLMLPGRDVSATISRLSNVVNNPEIAQRIAEASNKTTNTAENTMEEPTMNNEDMAREDRRLLKGREKLNMKNKQSDKQIYAMELSKGNNSVLSQVVGVIIGSPEFQRK